jgi:hypothetical protein
LSAIVTAADPILLTGARASLVLTGRAGSLLVADQVASVMQLQGVRSVLMLTRRNGLVRLASASLSPFFFPDGSSAPAPLVWNGSAWVDAPEIILF